MKRIVTLLLVFILGICASGCQKKTVGDLETKEPTSEQNETDKKEKNYEGRIGDTLETVFFDFSVDSAKFVDSYEGYRASEGNQLIDAVVSIKNTFPDKLPMFNSDFQIQWGPGDQDFGYGTDELEGVSGVMPDSYELGRAEKCQYHIIYEVPAGTTDFSISYLEIFADDSTGDAFFIYFEL